MRRILPRIPESQEEQPDRRYEIETVATMRRIFRNIAKLQDE